MNIVLPYKFEVGQPVYDNCGCCSRNRILIIREQFRDWDLSTLHTQNPTTVNKYIVGEYGYTDDSPGSQMRYAECNLRPWTYADVLPGTAIVIDNTIGIVRSHDTDTLTFYVHLSLEESSTPVTDESQQFTITPDNIRIPDISELRTLYLKMEASGLVWNQTEMTVKKTKRKSTSLAKLAVQTSIKNIK